MNIKTIILLIGIIIFIIGYINQYKIIENKKYVYKILPRNIYDDMFLSLPMSEYGEDDYNMNPTYILDDEHNYNSLFEKPIRKCKDTTSEGCDIELKPFHLEFPYDNVGWALNDKRL